MKVILRNCKSLICIGSVLLWQILALVVLGRRYFRPAQGGVAITANNEDATWLPPPDNGGVGGNKTQSGRDDASLPNENSNRHDVDKVSRTDSLLASTSATTMTASKLVPSLSADSVKEMCFPYNTDEWLNDNGNRTSNSDVGFTPELVDTLMVGPTHLEQLSQLLEQTLCHPDGILRNVSPQQQQQQSSSSINIDNNNQRGMTDDWTVVGWYQRFLYLAIHWRFHQPALEEYRRRKQCLQIDTQQGTSHVQSFMDRHKIGPMDYECVHGTKYLVIPVGSIGFGAFLNTQASLTILLALQSGRVPIFSVQSFFYWQKRYGRTTDPWLLAPTHCDRKDLQCYFLPPSPCTVTRQEIMDAPIWGSDGKEQGWFGRNKLILPPELEHHRVVVVNPGLSNKPSVTPQLRNITSTVIQELLDEWKERHQQQQQGGGRGRNAPAGLSWSDEDWRAMDIAQKWLIEKGESDPDGLLRHVYTYLLRPTPHYKNMLGQQLANILPADLDPSQTVGFAIRGSDKCIKESTCLPFNRYMELATDVAYPSLLSREGNEDGGHQQQQQQQQHRPKLIMTTEDPGIFNQSLAYQRNTSFPFEFVVNDQDNMQGSGFPREFKDDGENTIISSLLALQMHLSAGRVYLNCCSNFHGVLSQLLWGQCGAVRHGLSFAFDNNDGASSSSSAVEGTPSVTYCLNDERIPRQYRICCQWSSNVPLCKEIWDEYRSDQKSFMEREGNPKM